MSAGWVGVDLDGTLAVYHGWDTAEHRIGEPIPKMVERVRGWLRDGKTVKIFTARVGKGNDVAKQTAMVKSWCLSHLGEVLEVTCCKDYGMYELWDDRCVQMQTNTGLTVVEFTAALQGVAKQPQE